MAVLDRVPVDRISARAAQIRLAPLLLSLLALPFVAIGWTGFWLVRTVRTVGAALARGFRWGTAAVMVGYELAKEQHGRAG